MSLKPLTFASISLAAVLSACDDPLSLGDAQVENVVDTLTLFALRGTAIEEPSAYDLVRNDMARTDRGEEFDFAVDIDAQGVAQIFPTNALGFGRQSGTVFPDESFDQIDIAPEEGYDLDSAKVIEVENVFVVRSRSDGGSGSPGSCPIFVFELPRYGKFRVLSIDTSARRITFEALVNVNCGFRSLEPGLPDR